MTEPGLGFLETPYACRPKVTTARPTPYEQAERTKSDTVSGARLTIATRLTGVARHDLEVVTQMPLDRAPDDAPVEVKRAMTVTTLRRQLLERNWDSSCANALAVGTKGSKTKKLTELQHKLGERKKEVEDLRARLRDASQGQRRSGPARDGYAKRRDSDRDRSPSPRERQRDAWRRRN